MSGKPGSFFFHYHKAASLKAKANRLTVHWQGQCLIVAGVDCRVPIKSRNHKTQPRCVMAGKAREITIVDNIAVIT